MKKEQSKQINFNVESDEGFRCEPLKKPGKIEPIPFTADIFKDPKVKKEIERRRLLLRSDYTDGKFTINP